nr:hypothetical protein 3 - Choristoneura fumiferana nuclear polyhedrosis virus [Choristoneura fumiferana multiple nucleopolyhedrovirus]
MLFYWRALPILSSALPAACSQFCFLKNRRFLSTNQELFLARFSTLFETSLSWLKRQIATSKREHDAIWLNIVGVNFVQIGVVYQFAVKYIEHLIFKSVAFSADHLQVI